MQRSFLRRAALVIGLIFLSFTALSAGATDKQTAVASPAGRAAVDAPHEIGGGEGWIAYTYNDKGGKVCYLVGKPSKSAPAKLTRRRVDAMITHRPGENATNVVSFEAGYPFKEGTEVELTIGGKKFSLFTDKDTAWAPDAATDKAVTEALAKAKRAVVKGTSSRGTATVDIYTLGGLPQALAAIDKTCNVSR
jgi:hypothetical protein